MIMKTSKFEKELTFNLYDFARTFERQQAKISSSWVNSRYYHRPTAIYSNCWVLFYSNEIILIQFNAKNGFKIEYILLK